MPIELSVLKAYFEFVSMMIKHDEYLEDIADIFLRSSELAMNGAKSGNPEPHLYLYIGHLQSLYATVEQKKSKGAGFWEVLDRFFNHLLTFRTFPTPKKRDNRIKKIAYLLAKFTDN